MTNEMTSEEAIEFLELEKESTKTLWDNVNHEGGREYFEKSLEVIDMAIKALKEQLMRDSTEEERKSVKDYIESISKPTGVHFDEAQPCEDCRNCKKWNKCPCGKEGHESGTSIGYSIGECKDYEPCEDCISREEIKEFINTQLTNNEEWASSATNEGRWREEEKYLYGIEILEGLSEYVNDLPSVTPQRPKGKWIKTEGSFKCSECLTFPEYIRTLNYCPSCGSYNGGDEKDADSD